MSILQEMQTAFSKIDMKKLDSCYDLIERNLEEAVAFAEDPDGYMTQKMEGIYLPPELHFHIQIDNEVFPDEQFVVANRIVFYRVINIPSHNKERLLTALGSQVAIEYPGILYPRACMQARCYECNIAIVNWVDTP